MKFRATALKTAILVATLGGAAITAHAQTADTTTPTTTDTRDDDRRGFDLGWLGLLGLAGLAGLRRKADDHDHTRIGTAARV